MKRPAALITMVAVLCGFAPTAGDTDRVLDPGARALLTSSYAAERFGLPPGDDALVPCFIEGEVSDGALQGQGAIAGTRVDGRMTARIPKSRLEAVSRLPGVRRIRAATRFQPTLNLSLADARIPMIRSGLPDTTQGLVGQDVLVGIVDTGIDWSHADFKDPGGTTRIAALWDQSDAIGPPPAGYGYGSAWTSTQINGGTCREVDNTFLGHGTHVTGIAAGNGRGTGNSQPAFTYVGMAPRARIAAVRTTFYDTDIVDGVSWIFGKATALGLPAVVNLSLGGQWGPHDGTTDIEQMLNGLSGPGRIVVGAAGNSNGMGVHGERIVPAAGEGIVSFRVFAYTPSPTVSEGVSVQGWYQGGDNIPITVRSPLGNTVGPVAKGATLVSMTPEGRVSIDHSGTEATNLNGDVRVDLEISDASGSPVGVGDWEIRMNGVATSHGGEVDFWIHDHSFPFPPAFVNGRDETEHLIQPGTADSLLCVAAHTTRSSWQSVNGSTYNYGQTLNQIGAFSSIGPRRDGVLKPDLSAPGSAIGSTHSTASQPNPTANILPDGVHKILQGTSMSAPHVTGAVALLLEKWPTLSASQARSALRSAARPDGFTGGVPNAVWGYGKLDLQALFLSRLAFSLEIDPPRFAHAGNRVYLLDLCTLSQAGTWPTRYQVKVTDSKGWLRYESGGTPVPIASYSLLTQTVPAGQRHCVPETGDLLIEVPPGTPSGQETVITFEAEPHKLRFMKQAATTTITVGALAAVDPAIPSSLDLSIRPGRSTRERLFHLSFPKSAEARLFLVDVQGRYRGTIWTGEGVAGTREVRWDGRGATGERLESGVYYARLVQGNVSRSRPVLLVF
jgi:subtilisin family serine protease